MKEHHKHSHVHHHKDTHHHYGSMHGGFDQGSEEMQDTHDVPMVNEYEKRRHKHEGYDQSGMA